MSEILSAASPSVVGVLRRLAHSARNATDMNELLRNAIYTILLQLPMSGAVIWLHHIEQGMLAPTVSRLPDGCSSNAIAASDSLVRRLMKQDALLLDDQQAGGLMLLTDHLNLHVIPIRSTDKLLGLLGFVGESTTLRALTSLLEISAALLSGPLLNEWIQRQQADSEDVSTTLEQFATKLREQDDQQAILQTLNDHAQRVFPCDWSAVYLWDGAGAAFRPVQLLTRSGKQARESPPVLPVSDNPLLRQVGRSGQVHTITDMRDEQGPFENLLQRYTLRGLMLIPLQRTPGETPGLLLLGYRLPLIPPSSRDMKLAKGLSRMVAVALEQTRQ